jgi:hypothetical protein
MDFTADLTNLVRTILGFGQPEPAPAATAQTGFGDLRRQGMADVPKVAPDKFDIGAGPAVGGDAGTVSPHATPGFDSGNPAFEQWWNEHGSMRGGNKETMYRWWQQRQQLMGDRAGMASADPLTLARTAHGMPA